ncbi:hypothetical protein D3C80_1235790 [compost metagenome]
MKTLYRPIGIKEFELIAENGFKQFPPRLDWQPIFYPVLNQQYAEQIAFEWNTRDEFSGYCGIVTKFEVTDEIFSKYAVQNVGDRIHDELWIPAEELTEFNKNIIGKIEVIKVFYGDKFNNGLHGFLMDYNN